MTKDAAFPKRMRQPDEFATMAISIFDTDMGRDIDDVWALALPAVQDRTKRAP